MPIDRLESQENRILFGRFIRLVRYRRNHTLRSLAKLIDISHAYLRKIELGQTPITRKVYERLSSILDFTLDENIMEYHVFYDMIRSIHRDILYLDLASAANTVKTLEMRHDSFQNTLYAVDYFLALFAFKSVDLEPDLETLREYHDLLTAVEPLMDESQRHFFYVYSGNYYYLQNSDEKSLKFFEAAQNMHYHPGMTAYATYLIGLSYSRTFQLPRSNRYLKRAMHLFEHQNNDLRVVATHIFITINDMKMGKKHGVEKAFIDGIGFSEQYDFKIFKRIIQNNLVVFYLKSGRFDDALRLIGEIGTQTLKLCFYRAYAHFMMGNEAKAYDIAYQCDCKSPQGDYDQLMYVYGLKSFTVQKDDAKMKDTIFKRFFEETLNKRAYFEIDIAYQYYNDFLVQNRRYKEAYVVTDTLIGVTKKAYH